MTAVKNTAVSLVERLEEIGQYRKTVAVYRYMTELCGEELSRYRHPE